MPHRSNAHLARHPLASWGARRRSRALLAAVASLGLALGVASAPGQAAAEELTLLGTYALPTGLKIGGVAFGGLSALDYDADTKTYIALSDDRAERGPARFYELAIDVTAKGITGVDIIGRVDLTDAKGQPFARRSLDPEGMRRAPQSESRGAFYFAHERDASGRPFVGVLSAKGRVTAAFTPPAYHMPSATQGVRVNLGYESLAVQEDGSVVIATEEALRQDGPTSTLTTGGRARVTVIDPKTGKPTAEYVYVVDPIAAKPTPAKAFAVSGLVELLAKPSGGFYALERSFSVGQGTVVKIYATGFAGATNVLGVESLTSAVGQRATPMVKTLLYTMQVGPKLKRVDNIEAITFGPKVEGADTLVLVSDNNFNPNGQATQFLAFKIAP